MEYENRVKYFYEDDLNREPPDIFELFRFYNQYFFQDKLNSCILKWSDRMTLCAGTCKYEGMGSCTITLSEPLLKYRSNNELKETLLHEMIHAFLFITDPESCKLEEGHGPKFKHLMIAISEATGLKITVFHKFHDEVDRCRQHVWRCDGPCQQKSPFYGFVKRSMNRPPQPADHWFGSHLRECGGTFQKVQEPEKRPLQKKIKINKVKPKQKETEQKSAKTLQEYFKVTNLKPSTRSLLFYLFLQIEGTKITLSIQTNKTFNYQDLKTQLDLLKEKLQLLNHQLVLDDLEFQKEIENSSQQLWKDLLNDSLLKRTGQTILQVNLEQSTDEVEVESKITEFRIITNIIMNNQMIII